MKHKVAELEGALLDAAVAKAEGLMQHALQEWEGRRAWGPRGVAWPDRWLWVDEWHPSTDWAIGGPLIERKRINLLASDTEWQAIIDPDWAMETYRVRVEGPTALIAAMRAICAAEFGEEVDLP